MTEQNPAPTLEQARIESLDVLRGFALLGILLLNILGFGLYSGAYFAPSISLVSTSDVVIWAGMEVFAEGAMRCLFSMLFGAGVALFTTGDSAKGAALHYKRNFWLLVIGLFDAYILMWTGDILVNYALVGFLLYFARNVRPSRLLIVAGVLLTLMSLMNLGTHFGMGKMRDVAMEVQASGEEPTAVQQEAIDAWDEFSVPSNPDPEEYAEEISKRSGSAASAFVWHAEMFTETLMFVVPFIMFWDALVMMLIGMALYKSGVLQGDKSFRYYLTMCLVGFALGLTVNVYEVQRAYSSGFEMLSTFPFAQVTYHFGRLGVAFGWMGLIIMLLKLGKMANLRQRLAAVGRMALTNYLMHSFVFMIIFTGVGFGLLGQFSRSQLYFFVLAMWAFQLWFSPWWLGRYKYGPVEWLWRGLTYGKFPANQRASEIPAT